MTVSRQVKIESLQDLCTFLGVKEEELSNYFRILDRSPILLIQKDWMSNKAELLKKIRKVSDCEYSSKADKRFKVFEIPKKDVAPQPAVEAKEGMLPLSVIDSPKFEVRTDRENGAILDLCQSIRKYGLLHPITVRPKKDGRFERVAGGNRLEAFKRLRKKQIAVKIQELSDDDALFVQLHENRCDQSLSDFDLGRVFFELNKKFSEKQIGEKVRLGERQIRNYIEHFKTCDSLGTAVPHGEIDVKELTERSTRQLRQIPDKEAIKKEVVKVVDKTEPKLTPKHIRQIVKERQRCDGCGCATLDYEVVEDNVFCKSVCFPKVQSGELKPKKKVVVEEKPRIVKPRKSIESWQHQAAVQHPKVSKMDEDMFCLLQNSKELQKQGWRVVAQKPYVIIHVEIKSDVTLLNSRLNREVACFFDNDYIHRNRVERDKENRQKACDKHGIEVLPLPYDKPSEKEKNRVQKQIFDALGGTKQK